MNKPKLSSSGLFPDSSATVIGLPANFNILEELEQADSIRLAMAFCHMTGWLKLQSGISKCKGTVQLITGLDFFQTEPTLLRTWNRLNVKLGFRPRLMTSESGIFHPKVLIVSKAAIQFALVGSGNLSEGGLRKNIECFVYTVNELHLQHLIKWFDDIFQRAQEFGEDDIRAYEVKYKKVRQVVSKIQKQQKTLESAIKNRQVAFMTRRQQAIKQAKQEFQKPEFYDGWRKRREAVEQIRQYLHYPNFDFTQEEWSKFYGIYELGHLIPIYRDRVFRQEKRLKEVLHLLVNETQPISERLSAILDRRGSHQIPGLRINTVSKILAAHDPSKWPVYNSPVETTLRHFGYQPIRGAGMAGRYEAYAKLMQDFMKQCGAKDVCALDWFFYWFAKEKKTSNPQN